MLIGLRLEALWHAIQQVQRSFIHWTTALKSAPSLWQTTYPRVILLALFAHDARLQHLINASAIMPRVSMTCPIRLVKCAAEIVQLSDSAKNIIELLAKGNQLIKDQRLVRRHGFNIDTVKELFCCAMVANVLVAQVIQGCHDVEERFEDHVVLFDVSDLEQILEAFLMMFGDGGVFTRYAVSAVVVYAGFAVLIFQVELMPEILVKRAFQKLEMLRRFLKNACFLGWWDLRAEMTHAGVWFVGTRVLIGG
jgi:hypothetical protein